MKKEPPEEKFSPDDRRINAKAPDRQAIMSGPT